MNVATRKEKEKMKMAMRKAGEKGRQATNFKEAVCCSSAVVQGKNGEKIVYVMGVPGVT